MQILSKLSIGIDSSKFIDGDYEDFVIDETREFALKFEIKKLAPALTNEKSVEFDRGNGHNVCAEVVYADSTFWVIDFGFLAFCASKPPDYAKQGSYVKGKIGIDPFFYKEYLNRQSEIPELTYNWKVEIILRKDEFRFSNVNEDGVDTSIIYPEYVSWIDITKTEARVFGSDEASYELTLQNIT
jgi:hypothetical protein